MSNRDLDKLKENVYSKARMLYHNPISSIDLGIKAYNTYKGCVESVAEDMLKEHYEYEVVELVGGDCVLIIHSVK